MGEEGVRMRMVINHNLSEVRESHYGRVSGGSRCEVKLHLVNPTSSNQMSIVTCSQIFQNHG